MKLYLISKWIDDYGLRRKQKKEKFRDLIENALRLAEPIKNKLLYPRIKLE